MRKEILVLVVSIVSLLLTSSTLHAQKIGVLLITGGISEDYAHEWRVGFYDHLFPVWPAGFLAGGPKEGTTCYTIIHYADEAEAFICNVAEGTPIDAFCNEYTGLHPVHSLYDHWPGLGDSTFFDGCFSQILPAAVFTGSHSTIDPVTLNVIEGPHIDDPAGSGIGVADFVEITSFDFMRSLYHYPDHKNPSRRQDLKWFYGNDTPSFLGYPPDTPELTNVKDALTAALPEFTFAFRHGSEAYMKNLDAYGNPKFIPDSTETAIEELINDENVDRIIVITSAPGNSNMTTFGPCWRNQDGAGISALENKTYKQCLDDVEDGVGPTQEELDEYYTYKPWEELLKISYPEIEHLVHETDPTMEVDFARGLGEMDDFELAVLEMLNHTISKYSIPDTVSLKVIVAGHGLSAGWQKALECDSYDNYIYDMFDRLVARIGSSVPWAGSFEVVGGENEMSEAEHDPVNPAKPHGDVWSTGEQIDVSINGTYVNELGQAVDNGTGNFDYIVVIPVSWASDSTDTLGHGRSILGNNILSSIQGNAAYARGEHDEDGSHYDTGDFDSEYFTVKVLDGTGWPSVPGCIEDPDCEINNPPVYKGASAPDATTVIVTGTILALGNSTARTHLTDAAVDAIVEAVENPGFGGYGDACDCEGNFDCDQDCDGTDAALFKIDFGRSGFSDPCTSNETCNGDFDCDVDVDGTDAAVFKKDFGRSGFSSPCPTCTTGDWCIYSPPSP
jgi:hypothetical protein